MRFRRAIALVAIALAPVGPSAAQSSRVAEGDRAWSERAGDFAQTGRVSAEAVERALDAYQSAFERSPDRLDLRFKIMETLYFKGYFVVQRPREKRLIFERLAGMAERTVRAAGSAQSGAARAHFWAAVAWGLWGMSHSYLASGSRGVAGKIRDHAQRVIELDKRFADAGGLRLLGRLHTVTPKMPFFTGWIDRSEGLSLLERAHRLSDRDPRNALFLAEAILKYRPDDRDRALELLRQVSARSPDPDYLVEQTEALVEARRLLADLEGGS